MKLPVKLITVPTCHQFWTRLSTQSARLQLRTIVSNTLVMTSQRDSLQVANWATQCLPSQNKTTNIATFNLVSTLRKTVQCQIKMNKKRTITNLNSIDNAIKDLSTMKVWKKWKKQRASKPSQPYQISNHHQRRLQRLFPKNKCRAMRHMRLPPTPQKALWTLLF